MNRIILRKQLLPRFESIPEFPGLKKPEGLETVSVWDVFGFIWGLFAAGPFALTLLGYSGGEKPNTEDILEFVITLHLYLCSNIIIIAKSGTVVGSRT